MMPDELGEALMIVGLCRQFGCLPSQLLAEDVELLHIAALVNLLPTEGS